MDREKESEECSGQPQRQNTDVLFLLFATSIIIITEAFPTFAYCDILLQM